MEVTRIRRTRYLAMVKPGSLRDGLHVRTTASQRERTLRAENSVPVSPGLVKLTVTEVSFR